MKFVAAAALLLALAAAPARARQQPRARLVDEFGAIQYSDLLSRLDNFAVELQNEPGARGLVAAYAARHRFPGWPLRRADTARAYLVDARGVDAARVSAVHGGLRDDTAFELWLIPAGAEPPVKPFDVSLFMAGEKNALPFDRFSVRERGGRAEAEYVDVDPDSASPWLYDLFAEVLRRDPSLRGCVVGYTSRRGSLAAARRIASRAKTAMAKAHPVDVGRVVALGGGRREHKMIELWLVPPGAPLPKPTPGVRTAPRRRR